MGHGPTFWAEIANEVPEAERCSYPKGPVTEEGAVPRLMRQYGNLWADLSAMSGLNAVTRDPVFGLAVPTECPGVPAEILIARNTWHLPEEYDKARERLAGLFRGNFSAYEDAASEAILEAGPREAVTAG